VAAARPAGPLTGRGAARLALVAVPALVCLAALVALPLLVPRVLVAGDRADRRAEVLHAARQQAVNFTTLDHRTLDRDLRRVLDGSTGSFRAEFAAGTTDLRGLVTANKAVSRGEVLEAGIVSADDDSARVLVVADSTVTNTASEQPERRHYRIQMDLQRSGGRWLVSDLTFVG
jgi:Mce-associated membrane protein